MQPDPSQGYVIVIESLSPVCEGALRSMCSKMGSHAKKNLAKRLKTSNAEVQRFLEEIGLTSP